MTIQDLLEIAKPYGVVGISLGGCVDLNWKGTKTAMRRSGHAHNCPVWKGKKLPHYGWICIKSSRIERLLKADGKPNQLFFHEVSHIYRRSRTQKEGDKWAWNMTRNYQS